MNLHRPLILGDATTERVELVPTKDFFKPVLVITAPIEPADAELLNAGYLFQKNGKPRDFEGTHRLHGDLPGAEIELKGVHQTESFKSEKAARFGLFIQEKVGMTLRVRIHLPENEEKLHELLTFLSNVNKSAFQLQITDAQRSLITVLEKSNGPGKEDEGHQYPQPDEEGYYDERRATLRPFKKGKITAVVMVVECEDGYRSGWKFGGKLKSGEAAAGARINKTDPAFAAESEAVEAGARALLNVLDELPEGDLDAKIKNQAYDWLIDMAPKLRSAVTETVQ